MMLPIALMIADEVSVAGADGRKPTETYFWQHGPQYADDLMKSVFDAHPGFFKYRDYGDYYDVYCGQLESLIQAAESSGKSVLPAGPSWIPALSERGAPEPTG
jgi:hypothetical protein